MSISKQLLKGNVVVFFHYCISSLRVPSWTDRNFEWQFLLSVFPPCDAGYPDPEVVWFKDDQSIRESRHFQIDYDEDGNCSLIISDVCGDDDAKYTCKAVNSLGEATCTAELIVETMEEGEGEGEEEEEEEEEWNKAREKQFLGLSTKTISLKLKNSR